ncbi:MAG: patatin-like phospholipase family protein [Verrucomicrobiota bacterium]
MSTARESRPKSRFQQWCNFVFVASYGLAFAFLLILLPLTAYNGFPGSSLVGGIFLELKPIEAAWMTVAFLIACWSLMFTQGLVIDACRSEASSSYISPDDFPVKGGPIPGVIQKFLNIKVTHLQLLLFTAFALPGFFVVCAFSNTPERNFLLSLLFGLVSYLVMIVICYPARAVDRSYIPINGKPARVIWNLLDRLTLLRRFFRFLNRLLSLSVRKIPPLRILLDEENELQGAHFFAISSFLLTLIVLLLIGKFFPPSADDTMPPGVYFYLAMTLTIWMLGALQFHLSRFRVSPILLLILIVAVGYRLTGYDHVFDAYVTEAYPEDEFLKPEDIVLASQSPENLVVVTSTGGGILASGWLTASLKELIAARPELRNEIRLLSTVSGSSTGAAFYLDGLMRQKILPETDPEETRKALDKIYKASVKSSLESLTHSIAYLDFWRMVTGGFLPFTRQDRGLNLERAWQKNAGAGGKDVAPVMVSDLREGIRTGQLPAVIFNTTVMEVGRRVMITPVDFKQLSLENPHERARDLSGYFDPKRASRTDVSIWSAARLSATFPYVTPAAKAQFHGKFETSGASYENRRNNHFIDGGYYDNYGVASAIDWLDPILEARINDELPFKRLLIIQLRAFMVDRPGEDPPASAALSAVVGPLLGVASVYSGAAITRNEISLSRYLENWQRSFQKLGDYAPIIQTVILERPEKSGPLSWFLTSTQIKESLENPWIPDPERPIDPELITHDLNVDGPVLKGNPDLLERKAWIPRFLSGDFDQHLRNRSQKN